ncbi:MAG: DUF924 domain-containing protein [Pseudolabrys sp.]|jgi:uncharacterized protein (DUF924 family)
MSAGEASPNEIVAFWRDVGPKRWFEKDDGLDEEIRRRFLAAHEAAADGRLASWEQHAQGALALLILLDQFPRNMFRGDAGAFATDPLAREIASRAILAGFDGATPADMRGFFYLPFMHSEALADQEKAIVFYRAHGSEDGLKWAELHADIIRRFGRFPHRNAVLGRASTPEEESFLAGGGFAG